MQNNTIQVHSIETLGALDGPGIRTVLFLSGCSMRCKYCHNPDTWQGGNARNIQELADWCMRYKAYYGKTGGVTLSGGEPLLQAEATVQLLQALNERGIHTAIDTGGGAYCPEALALTDLVLLDIKHPDPEAFADLTGVPQTSLLRTLSYLRAHHKRFWVRHVCVPGLTDTADVVRAVKEMAYGAEKIELLPYHTMGVAKWEKLGLTYPLAGVPQLSNAKLSELNAVLQEPDSPVSHGVLTPIPIKKRGK